MKVAARIALALWCWGVMVVACHWLLIDESWLSVMAYVSCAMVAALGIIGLVALSF